jgi:hypothetical protein
MITVRVDSGVGNQLFQFAAGRALAEHRNTELCIDPLSYAPAFRRVGGRVIWRGFLLQELGFECLYSDIPDDWLSRIRGYSRIRNWLVDRGAVRYRCTGAFSPSFESLPAETVLIGYFQDQRYWLNYGESIVEEVAGTLAAAASRLGLGCEPVAPGAAALHVRRGDYLGHPEFLPEWFEGYYLRAMAKLLDEADTVEVFSDDPAWCSSAFAAFRARVRIRVPQTEFGGLGDLLAMASATRLAIANSSFSWWAARLGSRVGQAVLAPQRWFSSMPDLEARLYLPNWEVIR